MSLTNAQLRARVADELRISKLGVSLSAEDAAKLDAQIADCTAELRELGLVWWSQDAIPDAVAYALRVFVAARAAMQFGKAGMGFEVGEERGRRLLASLKSSQTHEPMRPDYF